MPQTGKTSGAGRRETLIRFSLVCVSLCLGIVIAELVLRVAGYHYRPMRVMLESSDNDWRRSHAFGDRYFEYDPHLIWRTVKNLHPLNQDGFRGALLPGKKSRDALYLFALGDSNTMGWMGTEGMNDANWPARLEDHFTLRGKSLKVTNAGAYGYSSFQGVRLLEQLLPYEPDVVLVSFGCNDAHMVYGSDREFARKAMRLRQTKGSASRLLQLCANIWEAYAAKGASERRDVLEHRVGVAEYQENLGQMLDLCNARGIRCILLTRPYTGDSQDPEYWLYYAAEYYEATKEVAAQRGADLIDVHAHFKDKPELFTDNAHFSEAGHEEAARFIGQELKRILE